jgi:hypothetical protein
MLIRFIRDWNRLRARTSHLWGVTQLRLVAANISAQPMPPIFKGPVGFTEKSVSTNVHCGTYILLSTTDKIQRYTIFFIIADAIHVSGGFSAHHQELKNCTHIIWYVPGLLLLPLAWLGWKWSSSLARTRCCVYSSWTPDDGRRNRPKPVQHWQ